MKQIAVLVPLLLAFGSTLAAEPPVSKADCDAVLTSEVRRLDDSFLRTRQAWEQSVNQRFMDHANDLTAAQMHAARATFDQLVIKHSDEYMQTVALPGVYRMLLAIPEYDPQVCANRAAMHAMGDRAITGFLKQLAELYPLIETSVDVARRTG